jgi:nucleotide-binding universal stress UspA family protein
MQRFENILVVADSSLDAGSALTRAVELARVNAATVTVISVQREIERNLPNLQREIRRQQESYLQQLTRGVSSKGVNIRTKAITGIDFLEIIRKVVAGHHDLVIKPAEGRGGLGRWLFGSTDWHLLRKCPCPVWIMKASKRQRYSRILAAVDPTPGDTANQELSKLILGLATSLAGKEGSELHVVHAWSAPSGKLLRSGRSPMSQSDVDRYLKERRKAHKQALTNMLADYDLSEIPNRIHLLKGDPADVIPRVSREIKADLVVMGTVARTGIAGFFIGNTAERTLNDLDCSVLTVKPEGFKTPIG